MTQIQIPMLKSSYKNRNSIYIICTIVLISITKLQAQMPVKLIKFEAKYENKKIAIEWETASEINNHIFQIERSENGEEYETIVEMILPESEANSAIPKQYKAEDCSPRNGTSFYRLKQIDLNGTYEYFDPVVVDYKVKAGFYFNTILFNERNKSILISVHNDQKENIHCTIVNYAGANHDGKGPILHGRNKSI